MSQYGGPERRSDPYGIRDYLEARFDAIEGRFRDLDRRLGRIEDAGPRAGAYGAVGTAIGAAIVAVAQYLGIGQQR